MINSLNKIYPRLTMYNYGFKETVCVPAASGSFGIRAYASVDLSCRKQKPIHLKTRRPQVQRFCVSARQKTKLCEHKARMITTKTCKRFVSAACCTWSSEGINDLNKLTEWMFRCIGRKKSCIQINRCFRKIQK